MKSAVEATLVALQRGYQKLEVLSDDSALRSSPLTIGSYPRFRRPTVRLIYHSFSFVLYPWSLQLFVLFATSFSQSFSVSPFSWSIGAGWTTCLLKRVRHPRVEARRDTCQSRIMAWLGICERVPWWGLMAVLILCAGKQFLQPEASWSFAMASKWQSVGQNSTPHPSSADS